MIVTLILVIHVNDCMITSSSSNLIAQLVFVMGNPWVTSCQPIPIPMQTHTCAHGYGYQQVWVWVPVGRVGMEPTQVDSIGHAM